VKHPKLDRAVQLDVLPAEVSGLETETDLVILEVRLPDQDAKRVVVSLDTFNALGSDIDETLSTLRALAADSPSLDGRSTWISL
jgi:hypothetical protein